MYQYYFSNHFENPFWSSDHQIILTFELSRSIIDFGLTNKKNKKNENAYHQFKSLIR